MSQGVCFGAPEAHLGGKMKGSTLSARTLPEANNYCCIAAWISVTCRVLVALSRLPLTFTCLPSNCLAFVLVIDLVGSGVSLQNVLVTGFHYCSRVGFSSLGRSRGRALCRTGLIGCRWAGLRRAGLRRAVRWACRRARSCGRARTRAGLIAGLGKRRRQHSCHQRKDSYHSESLLHHSRSSKIIDEWLPG